jgi:uncharacterized lipoprotein YddW (UPF0748 family)
VISARPDWANYDNRGRWIPPGQTKPFLDPANPEVRSYLLRLFDEIVSRYDVDGLQLDYIRYPFQDPSANRTYGYGMAARQQFHQLTGIDPATISPNNRDLWQRWTEFRTHQIDTFVTDASKLLHQRRPNLILSVAVFPLPEHERIQKLQQHWEVWALQGTVDLVVPMTYALDTNQFQRLAQPWLSQARPTSALILPGIRLLNLPEVVAIDQIQALRDSPAGGYSLFAAENLSDRLQTIFSRTQGAVQKPAKVPVPYRQPFSTAAARFDALQREWSFLLANRQLWIREPELSTWRKQATSLAEALSQLADKPSADRLDQANASLTAFQFKFADWMRLQALQNGYQVQSWKNRLASLDTLLRYGGRVSFERNASSRAKRP